MRKMIVAQVAKPGEPFELVERDVPQPGPGQVRVRVLACGICYSDRYVKNNLWPGLQYPRVPGHEVVGVIEEVGAGVTEWKKGDRVGIGWHGGHDFVCPSCRRGDFIACVKEEITGMTRDGGGYILAASHTIPPETPDENIFAMYKEAGISRAEIFDRAAKREHHEC